MIYQLTIPARFCPFWPRSSVGKTEVELNYSEVVGSIPPKKLHHHCFHFLLGITVVPRETENNVYAILRGVNKVLWTMWKWQSQFTVYLRVNSLFHNPNPHAKLSGRFVVKQGNLQPRFYSKAGALSTQSWSILNYSCTEHKSLLCTPTK